MLVLDSMYVSEHTFIEVVNDARFFKTSRDQPDGFAALELVNDTEARAIHLAFALFLAFLAWPARANSPRDRVPLIDWLFAAAGAFAGAYLLRRSDTANAITIAAIITGDISPLMMRRISASISSWKISRCSIVRTSASVSVMGMAAPRTGRQSRRAHERGRPQAAFRCAKRAFGQKPKVRPSE